MKYLIIILSFVVVNEMSSQFKVGSNTKQIGNNNFFELESLIGSKVVITKDSGIMGIGTATPLVDLDIVSKKVATNTINADFGLLRLARPTSTNVKWGHVAQFNLGSYTTGGAAHTRLDIGLNNDGNLTPSSILTLQGNGNVGVGTVAPSNRLEVAATGETLIGNATARISNYSALATDNFAGLMFKANNIAGEGSWKIGSRQENSTEASDQNFHFTNSYNGSSYASRMVVTPDGNVGIGNTAPLSRLHVTEPINNAAFQSVLTVDANPATLAANGFNGVNPDITKMSSGIQFKGWNGKNEGGIFRQTGSADKSHMLFTVNTTNDVAMVINENRNVGVGTTAPTQRMHIKGINNQPASTGTISNAILRIDGSSNHALDIGTYTNVPYGAYLQSVTTTDLGSAIKVPLVLNPVGGNVGIGIDAPATKLEVNGAATNTSALNAGSLTSIDFSASNIAFTSATATNISLNNLKNGGAYTLIFTSTAATGTVAFSATGFTFVYVGTEARTSGKKHIYSLIVAGTEVYVTMGTQN